MGELNSEVIRKGIVIKGSFYSFTRILFVSVFSGFLVLCCLYKLINPDVARDSEKYEELISGTIGMVVLAAIFYWLLTTLYYYYELKPEKIIVRNFIKPYHKELPLSTLLYVNLYGDIERSKTKSDNCLEFIYQYNDESKNYRYTSVNYNRKDWIALIGRLKELNVRIEDPHGFFKNGDVKFDDL